MGLAYHCVYLSFHSYIISRIRQDPKVGGGPGVKPGFAASDAAVLFDYTTHPLELAPGIQPGPLR